MPHQTAKKRLVMIFPRSFVVEVVQWLKGPCVYLFRRFWNTPFHGCSWDMYIIYTCQCIHVLMLHETTCVDTWNYTESSHHDYRNIYIYTHTQTYKMHLHIYIYTMISYNLTYMYIYIYTLFMHFGLWKHRNHHLHLTNHDPTAGMVLHSLRAPGTVTLRGSFGGLLLAAAQVFVCSLVHVGVGDMDM